MNYTFEIVKLNENFTISDIFTEWVTSDRLHSAREIIEKAYPREKGYTCKYIGEGKTWD